MCKGEFVFLVQARAPFREFFPLSCTAPSLEREKKSQAVHGRNSLNPTDFTHVHGRNSLNSTDFTQAKQIWASGTTKISVSKCHRAAGSVERLVDTNFELACGRRQSCLWTLAAADTSPALQLAHKSRFRGNDLFVFVGRRTLRYQPAS